MHVNENNVKLKLLQFDTVTNVMYSIHHISNCQTALISVER